MKTFVATPLITEKSMAKAAEGVYQFIVPTWVGKHQIADYIARIFNVSVSEVRTARFVGEHVRFKGRAGKTSAYKKATVTLVKGNTIADFSLPVETKNEPTSNPEKESAVTPEAVTESKITVRSKSKKA